MSTKEVLIPDFPLEVEALPALKYTCPKCSMQFCMDFYGHHILHIGRCTLCKTTYSLRLPNLPVRVKRK